MDPKAILAIDRPHPRLMKLYLVRAVFSGPALLVALPILWFRYHTMRYRFDEEGISMSWGILFRREVKLTYARIQDIHLVSGVLQRWLGLADLHIQTASGSATAEMTLEGLLEFEAVRDFLYSRMRGARDSAKHGPAAAADETLALLREIVRELRGAREALERGRA